MQCISYPFNIVESRMQCISNPFNIVESRMQCISYPFNIVEFRMQCISYSFNIGESHLRHFSAFVRQTKWKICHRRRSESPKQYTKRRLYNGAND